jgi:Domain of unknown function (DUF4082)
MTRTFMYSCLLASTFFAPASAQSVLFWTSTSRPGTITDQDSQSVELGIKFSANTKGTISAIRFYKGSQNTGQHTVSLWAASGTKLASATSTNETASGWQTVNLIPPVNITAGAIYVASYHAPYGHYSDDRDYFPYNKAPLSAPQNAGVYNYSPGSSFPTNVWNDSNYGWMSSLLRDR